MASKQILNDIQKLIRWSQLTNLFSVPTDCDQRNERQGWMGDAQATAEEAMMNFDMAAFYTNFIRDISRRAGGGRSAALHGPPQVRRCSRQTWAGRRPIARCAGTCGSSMAIAASWSKTSRA